MLRRSPLFVLVIAGGVLAGTVAARQQIAFPAISSPAATDASPQLSAEFFEARIRPILAANCFDCHAEDAKGGLRVDSREGLLAGGDSGPAIIPGNPDESLLLKAVRHVGTFPKMPRGRSKLKDDDIQALMGWIKAGAPWPASPAAASAAAGATPAAPRGMTVTAEHRAFWAFQPLSRVRVPAVRDRSWARTDVDRFILARLERDGLRPVGRADKLTLIRRATLDLTGLPPMPEDIDAFLKDSSPGAFAKVVDRLLASPAYGEQWARMWLDVARYGEDDYRSLDPMGRGYAPYPNAYLYRDWVVKAFNDDLPYGDFVRAQLAADLLDDRVRLRMLPALGFLGLGPWYYDNGAVEITRADERHDRVDAVSRAFLGLTVGCARCHDHKYDPIPTRDYYALAGVFLNTEYHEYPQAPKAIVDEYTAAEKTLEKKEKLLAEYLRNESKGLAATLVFQAAKYMQAAWRVTGEPKADRQRTVDQDKLDFELFDRWLRFLDKPPVYYPFLKSWQDMVKAGGTREQAKKLAEGFQDLLVDVVLEQREVEEQNDIIRAKALPENKKKEPANKPNEFKTNDDFCPGCGLELKSMPTDRTNLFMDVFQRDLDSTAGPGAVPRAALLAFTGWGLERQLGPDRRALIEALRQDIDAMKKALPEKYAYVHGVRDLEKPVDLKIAIRGSAYRTGDEAPRGFLEVLASGTPRRFTKGSGRLELAEAIVAQPIAARVIVNRIWKGHFGTGLVDTPSNFGINGERPSHPELLEHLAQWFVDRRMSIKALHRELMLSSVYQLGTGMSQSAFERDSGNRLYWRANRRRMSAEQIRDAVLLVSGALETRIGGPSEPLTPLAARRTLYGRVSRYKLDEFLQLFDYPSPNQSAEKRFATNVPLQRLFFMNSDFMQQHAEKLAERVNPEPTDRARIQKVYRLIFGRAPTAAELQAGLDFLATEPMKQYEDRKAEEKKAEEKKTADKTMGEAKDAGAPAAPDAAPPGMMSGVTPGAPAGIPADKKLPVTPFGRYVKILLSSNEFLFVN